MSTLEYSKSYGLQERQQTLADLARARLNGPTPHQAPQRERATSAQTPSAGRVARRRTRRWTELLSPDRNMGVPQLMMILEPNLVWEHTIGYYPKINKNVEAMVTPGEFLEGWHKGGRLAHGVYEGTYWELIGDCDEMIEMLKKLARAPSLLEEPTLNLPESPDLPKWEDFKPSLQALPSAPQMPLLKLPAFRAPILDTELPFIEPDYVPLPEVPNGPKEEPAPMFFTPELAVLDPFEAPEYVQPEPPIGAEQPHPPVIGKPQHGHDWTGQRPFVITAAAYVAPRPLDVGQFRHPPTQLPALPFTEDLHLDRPDLDLNPVPRLELAWECGPDPEPSYASVPTPARMLSRPPSPPRSSRPVSAGPAPLPTRPATPPAATPPPAAAPAPATPAPRLPAAAATPRVAAAAQSPETPGPTWEDVSDVDSGKPRLWMNFDKPFAELPPLFLPPQPQPGEVNGPEPMPDDFPHEPLEDEPEYTAPEERALPAWDPPVQRLPRWVPPCEPRPIGFLRGTAPVLIIDVSGTMNPRMNGRFRDMKACVCDLLEPEGELATAAGAFDVIAFCSGAWSWSATYDSRMDMLAASQTFHSGRQAGGKLRPGSSRVAEKTKIGARLQPTEPDMLADAQNWVAKWPDAVGHTSMLASFLTADGHWGADCWYIFSDGQADDPSQCTQFLEQRIRHGQKVPVIHTVGFFPDGVPDNFEGRRYLQLLSSMTGGSYQEYDRNMQRIYREGVGFVPYNVASESPADRMERDWAEGQVRAERKKNIALGVAERFEVTMARVEALHKQVRINAAAAEYEASIAGMRAAYQATTAEIRAYNAGAHEATRARHDAASADIRARNAARLASSRAAYESAHAAWREAYDVALAEWEANKAVLEAQRAEALAALNAVQGRRGSSSRSSSRPSSAAGAAGGAAAGAALPSLWQPSRPTSASSRQALSRPTSALVRPPSARSTGGGPPPAAADLGTTSSSSRPVSATQRQPSLTRPTSARQQGLPPSSQIPGSSPFKLPAPHEDRPWTDPASSPAATGSRQQPPVTAEPSDSYSDQGIIEDEEGDEVSDLPALDLEDSQELKRALFPEEVVQALDDENAAALDAIRGEWQALLDDTAARNKHKLEVISRNQALVDKYVNDVIVSYASAFVSDVIVNAATRIAANEKTAAAAEAAHRAEIERVRARNEEVARLHTQEVEDKKTKEENYVKAVELWKEKREELGKQYEADIVTAKTNHVENVERAKHEWELKKEEMDAVNDMRLKDAQARHDKLLEELKQVNLKHRAEYDELVRARKATEAENQARLGEARLRHKVRLELLQEENTARLAAAQTDHQELCARLAAEHEEAKEAAQQEYDELRAFLTKHNEALMAEARAKYAEALALAQAEFDELCTQLREQNARDLEHVRRRNREIWPQVQVARLAQAELGRVQAFAEHIRYCANKFALGVNFLPNTPNFDRVVEMQALTESLQRAFPDYPTDEYPWPDHERKGEPGTGWVAAPQARSLHLPDPAAEIARLAAGRNSSRASSAGASSSTPSGAVSPAARPASPSRTPRIAFAADTVGGGEAAAALPPRGANRLASASAGTLGPPPRSPRQQAQGGQRRPESARSSVSQHEERRVSSSNSVVSGSGSFGQQQQQRPDSAGRQRFSNLVSSEGLTGGANAARLRRSQSSVVAGGGGGPLEASASASPLAAAAGARGLNRPASATARGANQSRPESAHSAHSGGKGGQQEQGQQQRARPLSASMSLPRPSSGQQYLPARVAAQLGGMQASLTAMRGAAPHAQRSPSGAAAGRPPLAGFVRDLPRLHYTEVDVKALDAPAALD